MSLETLAGILLITNIITLICLLIVLLYCKIPSKIIRKIIEPRHGKEKFLKSINKKGTLLDVGCGNNSPYYIKSKFPSIKYTGIDIGDYNQAYPNLADNYIITTPEEFADKIAEFENYFDTIISSHNLEHCNDRNKTLDSIIKALKSGGRLFLSFPTEKSINFPERKGTLNYYDDNSHKHYPPNFDEVIKKLKNNNMKIVYANKSYKPLFYYIIGFFMEKKSKREKKVWYPNWAYWGFEAIIWARKNI